MTNQLSSITIGLPKGETNYLKAQCASCGRKGNMMGSIQLCSECYFWSHCHDQ
jgi:hypothetical protein